MNSVITDPKKVDFVLSRGVSEVIQIDDLRKKMLSGKQLRIKLGVDPTSPDIHLGRTVPLLKLRDFQELGHQVVFIFGGFTAMIGDTSDKESERPMLSEDQVKENMKQYLDQIFMILDPEKTEVVNNADWLGALPFHKVSELATVFSVNKFIQRDIIRRRISEGKRVSLREMLYPLMQGYDSVAVRADVELGGSDQRFNTLSGRVLQEYFGQEPQNVVLLPLVNGLDGRKMSSSYGNGVYLLDSPEQKYGKIMSMRDDLVISYFTSFTRISAEDITHYQKRLDDGENPKNIKMALARTVVSMYHNDEKSKLAESVWKNAFEEGKIPENTKTVQVRVKLPLVSILIEQGVVSSKSEFFRLVKEGAIKFKTSQFEKKIIDPKSLVEESGALRIGKKRFLKLEVIKESKKK